MSEDHNDALVPAKPHYMNMLIGLCLAGSLALLWAALRTGDVGAESQGRQWQMVFLGLALALAAQWIVGGSALARKHQIALTCLILAVAGFGIQSHYGLAWSQCTPFIVGYGFLFVAAEFCALVGPRLTANRRTIQAIRLGVVVWNLAWGGYFASTSPATLPDVAYLYVAFSLLWTIGTAVIAWSEFCAMPAADRHGPYAA